MNKTELKWYEAPVSEVLDLELEGSVLTSSIEQPDVEIQD